MAILRSLSRGSESTSGDVAEMLGLTITNASELLRRYYRNGEVSRKLVSRFPKTYQYALTRKGHDRLEYWGYW